MGCSGRGGASAPRPSGAARWGGGDGARSDEGEVAAAAAAGEGRRPRRRWSATDRREIWREMGEEEEESRGEGRREETEQIVG